MLKVKKIESIAISKKMKFENFGPTGGIPSPLPNNF
jgi:hypothetical protein